MINDRIELVIIKNYLYNDFYMRKVFPFVKGEYFHDTIERIVFTHIQSFINGYKNPPSKEILYINLSNDSKLSAQQISDCNQLIDKLIQNELIDQNWLLEQTENFCKERALYNGIQKSIKIISGEEKKLDKGGIPDILSEALSVSFNNNIGHDYIDNSDDRFAFYHRVESKLAFDINIFNKITRGGVSKKTLNIVLAPTGVGKSFLMCHLAARYFYTGYNVLYITLEMSEEEVAKRIEANLFDVPCDFLDKMSKHEYDSKISAIKNKSIGKLLIKQYPTASANVNHFKSFLNEVKLKKNFIPDVIFVDYLNIATSARYNTQNTNLYTYVKGISEELRGMAVEYDVPIWTATQGNRNSYESTDISLEDTSESFGTNSTADLIIALISTKELEGMNRMIVKQLKNRYNNLNYYMKFLVGIERSKMKFFNVDEVEQNNLCDAGVKDKIEDDTPVFDKTAFGESSLGSLPNFDNIDYGA